MNGDVYEMFPEICTITKCVAEEAESEANDFEIYALHSFLKHIMNVEKHVRRTGFSQHARLRSVP